MPFTFFSEKEDSDDCIDRQCGLDSASEVSTGLKISDSPALDEEPEYAEQLQDEFDGISIR